MFLLVMFVMIFCNAEIEEIMNYPSFRRIQNVYWTLMGYWGYYGIVLTYLGVQLRLVATMVCRNMVPLFLLWWNELRLVAWNCTSKLVWFVWCCMIWWQTNHMFIHIYICVGISGIIIPYLLSIPLVFKTCPFFHSYVEGKHAYIVYVYTYGDGFL